MSEYTDALKFWDTAYGDEKPEKLDGSGLGCKLLEDELMRISSQGKVLDFGCGAGWASLYMGYVGKAHITAVDQSEKGIRAAVEAVRFNSLCDKITVTHSDEHFFDDINDLHYTAAFSSNTFDVIPTNAALGILRNIHRVLTADADVVIMLNPYATPEVIERTGLEFLRDAHYTKNGILRCINYTDEKWAELFSEFFTLDRIEHFRFDDEPEYLLRRMFIMKNKTRK